MYCNVEWNVGTTSETVYLHSQGLANACPCKLFGGNIERNGKRKSTLLGEHGQKFEKKKKTFLEGKYHNTIIFLKHNGVLFTRTYDKCV